MRMTRPVIAGLFIGAAMFASGTATQTFAQQPAPSTPPSSQPQARQRAPGVPMAPRADVARYRDQNADKERGDAERNPPMPRGVPSIIAP